MCLLLEQEAGSTSPKHHIGSNGERRVISGKQKVLLSSVTVVYLVGFQQRIDRGCTCRDKHCPLHTFLGCYAFNLSSSCPLHWLDRDPIQCLQAFIAATDACRLSMPSDPQHTHTTSTVSDQCQSLGHCIGLQRK